MTVESASYLGALNVALPDGGDSKSEGDNHLRLLKTVLKNTFPELNGRAWRSQTKSASYAATAADNMTMLRFDGAYTLTLPAAATLGNGWMCIIWANGGNVTITPNGAETVDSLSSVTVLNGNCVVLYCTAIGTREFATSGFKGGTLNGRLAVRINGQVQYDTAAISAESDTGDVIIALHAAGASAINIKHTRNTNQLEFFNSSGTKTQLVAGGYSADVGNIVVQNGYLQAKIGTQGLVYLGNSGSTYLQFNGSNYIMPNGSLILDTARQVQAGSFRAEANAYFFGPSVSISYDPGSARLQTTYRALHPNGYDNGTMGYAMVNSDAGMGAHSIQSGYIAVNLWGSGYGYSVFASDARHKDNIADAVYDATADILRFKFRKFDWKPEALSKGHVPLGLVAQELEVIDPRYVITPEGVDKPVKMLDDRSLLVLALKGLQEAHERITALEGRLANVQGNI